MVWAFLPWIRSAHDDRRRKMASVLEKPNQSQGDERFVLRGVNWETYEAILQALGDRPTRLTFDGENLELMSPSPIHEWYASQIARLLETLAFELGMPIRSGGSTTFK